MQKPAERKRTETGRHVKQIAVGRSRNKLVVWKRKNKKAAVRGNLLGGIAVPHPIRKGGRKARSPFRVEIKEETNRRTGFRTRFVKSKKGIDPGRGAHNNGPDQQEQPNSGH